MTDRFFSLILETWDIKEDGFRFLKEDVIILDNNYSDYNDSYDYDIEQKAYDDYYDYYAHMIPF